ncbi:hypothetical protein [Saccharothrix sp. ALI-22-I]|nr:hypothetical protein [Saccharothrix sp. ALI-22-I]
MTSRPRPSKAGDDWERSQIRPFGRDEERPTVDARDRAAVEARLTPGF